MLHIFSVLQIYLVFFEKNTGMEWVFSFDIGIVYNIRTNVLWLPAIRFTENLEFEYYQSSKNL